MQALQSTEQFEAFVNEAKAAAPKLTSNCYLSLEEVSRYIQLSRIFYEKVAGGIFFYCDEDTYYQTYFYYDGEKKLSIEKKDRPLVVRLIYKDGKKPPATLLMEQLLLDIGCYVRDVTVQLCARPKKEEQQIEQYIRTSLKRLESHGLTLFEPKEEHLEQLIKLRDGDLDPLHFAYMTREEKLQGLKEGLYQCLINAEGEICAMYIFEIVKGAAYAKSTVVAPKYRKLGIGTLLVYRFMQLANEKNLSVCYGWFVNHNAASIEMHKKIGFCPTGKASTQLVLE